MISEEGIEKALEDIELLKKWQKSTQKELAQLKLDHAEVATQTRQTLLDLRRTCAILKINADSDSFRRIIIGSEHLDKSNLITQMLLDAKGAKFRVLESAKPMSESSDFFDKWHKRFQDLQIDVLEG